MGMAKMSLLRISTHVLSVCTHLFLRISESLNVSV